MDDIDQRVAGLGAVTPTSHSEATQCGQGVVPAPTNPHVLTEQDVKLMAAYTPEKYNGDYPEFWNLTVVRMRGDVVLIVRLPTAFGKPPGASSSVRFTRDMWRDFVRQIDAANKVYEAVDFLDATI